MSRERDSNDSDEEDFDRQFYCDDTSTDEENETDDEKESRPSLKRISPQPKPCLPISSQERQFASAFGEAAPARKSNNAKIKNEAKMHSSSGAKAKWNALKMTQTTSNDANSKRSESKSRPPPKPNAGVNLKEEREQAEIDAATMESLKTDVAQLKTDVAQLRQSFVILQGDRAKANMESAQLGKKIDHLEKLVEAFVNIYENAAASSRQSLDRRLRVIETRMADLHVMLVDVFKEVLTVKVPAEVKCCCQNSNSTKYHAASNVSKSKAKNDDKSQIVGEDSSTENQKWRLIDNASMDRLAPLKLEKDFDDESEIVWLESKPDDNLDNDGSTAQQGL